MKVVKADLDNPKPNTSFEHVGINYNTKAFDELLIINRFLLTLGFQIHSPIQSECIFFSQNTNKTLFQLGKAKSRESNDNSTEVDSKTSVDSRFYR